MASLLYVAVVHGDRVKRALWTVVALKAVEITLYRPSVQAPLYDVLNGHVVFLGVHLVSVVEAGAILYLLSTAFGRAHFRWYAFVVSGLAAFAMVAIYVTASPSVPTVSIPPEPLPLSYWYVLAGFHSGAHLAAVFLCWRTVWRVGGRAKAVDGGNAATDTTVEEGPRPAAAPHVRASLVVLGAGLLLSCIPWLLTFQWLITDDTTWLDPIPKIDAVTGWCIALSVAPLLTLQVRYGLAARRATQQLEPLWRELTSAVPDLVMAQRVAAVRPHYGVYRRVVEVRDAMLQLRSYVSPPALELAAAYLQEQDVAAEHADAALTACWLAAALESRSRGVAPHPQQADLAGPGGADIDAELRHLERISGFYFSPLVDGYRRLLPAPDPT